MKFYLVLVLFLSTVVQAVPTVGQSLIYIQKQLAVNKYILTPEKQQAAYEKLALFATQLVFDNSNNPEALIYEGLVYSSFAKIKGPLGKVKLEKHAKRSFELAIKLDGKALDGVAYTYLGALYYEAMEHLSVGDEIKALKYLEKGLALNPNGVDSNYYYALYLMEKSRQYKKAKQHLIKAINAIPDLSDEIEAQGKKAEIERLIHAPSDNLQKN
ncbi:MAG: hypothetical protein L3J52_08680 [Proteobacteria bacterium]|nr:hypothetical protein [Pseudomonadota bacterium]